MQVPQLAAGAARALSSGLPTPVLCRVDQPIPSPALTSAPAPRSAIARVAAGLTAAFGWLMCTLATGAVAAFVALVTGIRPAWLVLLLAAPLTLVLKFCGCLHAVRWH